MEEYAYASPLRHWNAAFKVVFSVGTLLVCLGANQPVVSILVFGSMSFLLLRKGKLPLREWISLLKIPLFFVVMATLAVVVEISGETAKEGAIFIGSLPLYTTPQMLWRGASLFLRVMAAVSSMFFLTLTTPANEIIGVLSKVHVPKLLIELMYLIYRYIFILLDTQQGMRISAEARLGFCDYKTSLKSFGNIAGNLLVVSLKRAETYYDAMESRGYEGELRFLEEEKPVKKKHLFLTVLFELLLVAVWIGFRRG